MKNQFLEVGKIINKRGIAGELKLESYCDGVSALKGVEYLYTDNLGKCSYKVSSVKEYKGNLFIKLCEVTTAEAADELRGKILYADRKDLNVKKGAIFLADIIGLCVYDADTGKQYGKVTDIVNYGASDIYIISDGDNEYMLPAVDDIIAETNLEKGISVHAIKGIFDDAEEIR